MSLTKRLLILVWIGALAAIAVLSWQSYREAERDTYTTLYRESDAIYHFLMSVRAVFQQQFLQSELPLNKRTIGFLPAHAIPKISEEFARRWGGHHGVAVNTVSDRPRNPRNQADRYELEAINWFRQHQERRVFTREYREPGADSSTFLYASPLWIEESCLNCHGEREQAPQTVQESALSLFQGRLQQLHDQNHERFHGALAEAPLPVAVADITHHEIKGRIFLANPAFQALSGYVADELLGRPLFELFPEGERAPVEQMLYRASGHLQRAGHGSAGRTSTRISSSCSTVSMSPAAPCSTWSMTSSTSPRSRRGNFPSTRARLSSPPCSGRWSWSSSPVPLPRGCSLRSSRWGCRSAVSSVTRTA